MAVPPNNFQCKNLFELFADQLDQFSLWIPKSSLREQIEALCTATAKIAWQNPILTSAENHLVAVSADCVYFGCPTISEWRLFAEDLNLRRSSAGR